MKEPTALEQRLPASLFDGTHHVQPPIVAVTRSHLEHRDTLREAVNAPQTNAADAVGDPGADGSINEQDIAAYMADMILELRELAQRSGFQTLGRVLEIAESEAKLRVGDRR